MPRQTVGVVATNETGIGVVAGRFSRRRIRKVQSSRQFGPLELDAGDFWTLSRIINVIAFTDGCFSPS
jgi:hypothetical protein